MTFFLIGLIKDREGGNKIKGSKANSLKIKIEKGRKRACQRKQWLSATCTTESYRYDMVCSFLKTV